MVVSFSFNPFACDELLGECLASCTILGTAALVSVGISSLSQRTSYQFVNSNTGGRSGIEVINADPTRGGRGIFKCAVNKISVCGIKVSDQPTGEESTTSM